MPCATNKQPANTLPENFSVQVVPIRENLAMLGGFPQLADKNLLFFFSVKYPLFGSVAFFIFLSISLNAEHSSDSFAQDYKHLLENRDQLSPSERLHRLFVVSWEHGLFEDPVFATQLGRPDYIDRWHELSLEAEQRQRKATYRQKEILDSIEPTTLSEADMLNYKLFSYLLRQTIDSYRFPPEFASMPVNYMQSVTQTIPNAISIMPTRKLEDFANIITRLEGIPQLLKEAQAVMEHYSALGVTPAKITLLNFPEEIRATATDDLDKNPLWLPFKDIPESIDAHDREKLQQEARTVILETVNPAFLAFGDYLENTYIPLCREAIGWSVMPKGKEWYAYAIKSHTTTDRSAQEVHDIGLSEVKRIRAAMEKVIKQTGFEGTREEFLVFLRTDPQFYFDRAEDLMTAYRAICKRADPELIKVFGTLPRLPYGVVEVPNYMAKSQTTAYYRPGSLLAGRPGNFFANTYDLKSRPKFEMEALSLHEAVPGHHLQIAIAQELEGLPEFRKNLWITAYGEGWGLYSESLGEEMGFYKDPYSKFGQLSYEMWRAVRLVVDTGMHALGWSRQDAIDFFKDNSGLTEKNIMVEVDRYISWPGQALAYKTGELKIKELRRYATAQLGDDFDVREFHDQVLGHGLVPLDVLEAIIRDWVAGQK